MSAEHTLGRVVLDRDGIRRAKLWGLFGSAFDLSWDAITGWAVSGDVILSRGHPDGQVVSWILELDHAGGTAVVRWGRGAERFHVFAAAVAERLPERHREPRLGRRLDARLPPELAWMAGPDHRP